MLVGSRRMRRRNRIITAGIERMTAHQTPHGISQAPENTMYTDSFHRILRTARIKPTSGPQKRADQALINPDQEDEELLHVFRIRSQRRSSDTRSSALLCAFVGARKQMTQSTLGRVSARWRKSSRICRFTRLRSTALGALRLAIAKPKRAPPANARSSQGELTARNGPLRLLAPFEKVRLNWAGRRSLLAGVSRLCSPTLAPRIGTGTFRDSAGRALWLGGGAIRRDHFWSPYARENREYVCGAGCGVDKCVSWRQAFLQ